MKKFILPFLFLLSFSCDVTDNIERPKLVIGIVVDQMRQEYLYRFYDKFGNDGFKRLMKHGYMLKNAHFNYVPTYTGPGHTSVYTGTTPRVHGIIANDWYDKRLNKMVYCAEDTTASAVGGSLEAGHISPNNMLTTTITDELGQFFNFQSKIVGLSIKDRGAALPAGHNPTGAYWYDEHTGEFMTSTFYMDKLPGWVQSFNDRKLPDEYLSGTWETSYPIEDYTESAEDNRLGEKPLGEKSTPEFPYDLKALSENGNKYEMFKSTPYGNKIIKELAVAAIEGEDMGSDFITDFLAISFSSTDYIGHAFGPYSKEIEDTYIKLDQELESLFMYLDQKIGNYEYLVFLTADHAVAEIPKYLNAKRYPFGYLEESKLSKELVMRLTEKFGSSELISAAANNQIFLNKEEIKNKGLNESEVKAEILDFLSNIYGIASAYDAEFINSYSGSNRDINMLSAGYNAYRSGDLILTFNAGWLGEGHIDTGTSHGSFYTYDTHVPVLFYGNGVSIGSSVAYHEITDIAPTLSMMLNIKLPSGATGEPIWDLFNP